MTDPGTAALLKEAGTLAHFAPTAKPRCWIEPMAFNVVVEIDKAETVTKGGIILPDSKTERDRLACEEGTLVAISPLAFTYADWPDGASKPEVGDRVMVNRYSGVLREHDGKDYRIVEDKSLIAVLREK